MADEPLVDLTVPAKPGSRSVPGQKSRPGRGKPQAARGSVKAPPKPTPSGDPAKDAKELAIAELQRFLENEGNAGWLWGASQIAGADMSTTVIQLANGHQLKTADMLAFQPPKSYILARGFVEMAEIPAMKNLAKVLGPVQPYLWAVGAGGVLAIQVITLRRIAQMIQGAQREQHGPIEHAPAEAEQSQPVSPEPPAADPQVRPIQEVHVPSTQPQPVASEGGDQTPVKPDLSQDTSGRAPTPGGIPEGLDLAG